MATVVVTPTAIEDLQRLIRTHSLPTTTTARLKRSLEALAEFPLIGAPLRGRWARYRFILGPWRWMLVVYSYDPTIDRVAVVTIQDARSSAAATSAAPTLPLFASDEPDLADRVDEALEGFGDR